MDGVGARLGRSSTRFAPAAVFTGPVRKWTKRWVPFPNPRSTGPSNPRTNAASNGDSHLLLYKWIPTSSSSSRDSESATATAAVAPLAPPKRRFRYVPVSVTEQKQDAAENSDSEAGSSPQATQADSSNGKPDGDDVLMEEAQMGVVEEGLELTEEADETNLDLNLS